MFRLIETYPPSSLIIAAELAIVSIVVPRAIWLVAVCVLAARAASWLDSYGLPDS